MVNRNLIRGLEYEDDLLEQELEAALMALIPMMPVALWVMPISV